MRRRSSARLHSTMGVVSVAVGAACIAAIAAITMTPAQSPMPDTPKSSAGASSQGGASEKPGARAAAKSAGAKGAAAKHASGTGTPSKSGMLSGMGAHHHPIATRSPEAQKFFDQGLNLVYGFNHEEAVRSFKRAAAIDARAAMPLWGVALALGPNINQDVDPEREKQAYEAIQTAMTLLAAAPETPESERAYIETLAVRYTNEPGADLKELAIRYKDAMARLSARYPDDLDAATLYAESLMDLNPWKFWSADGEPAEGTEEIVRVLETVLRRDPMHPGANHYYIHAVEASPHPEKALASAARLETMAPAAGHLVHMPSHIYQRTGDYAASALSNKKAADADRAYIKATGADGVYPMMYYSHNLHFLSVASAMAGRSADAKKAADDLVANVAPAFMMEPMPPEMLAMLEVFEAAPEFVALRFQRWDDLLKGARPDKRLPIAGALWHYGRGMARAVKGDADGAAADRAAIASARDAAPADALFGFNGARTVLDLAGLILDARLAEGRGERDEAIALLRRAVKLHDGFAYDEPADWYYPVRETLGGALLRAGRAEEAEDVFRADLEKNPRNPRSLFGLLHCLEAQKRTEDAAWVREQFRAAWKDADVTLRVEDL